MHLFVDILLMITLEGPVNSDQSIEVQLVMLKLFKEKKTLTNASLKKYTTQFHLSQ